MLFPTLKFALFFFLVFFLYWYVFRLKRQRCILLVCASYIFYAAWDWRFCILLFFVSVLAGGFGYLLGVQKNYLPRKITLIIAVFCHISILAFFKYFYQLSDTAIRLLDTVGAGQADSPFLHQLQTYSLLLPVGISYYTFRALSYVFDIYLCKMRPVKPFTELLLYISFFPQLLAGPIVQAEPFFKALPENLSRDPHPAAKPIEFDRSMLFILAGLYKKMILAGFLSALAVEPVFANPAQCNTIELIVGLISYTFVIYCDFSGYSDMAVGIGLLLGFHTPANFNRPYTARSISDFWRRWHISFSSWLRDYVYFSFGGSRFGLRRTVLALVGTMLIAGIWHGNEITFLLWGGLQGIACAAERIFTVVKKERQKHSAQNPIGAALTEPLNMVTEEQVAPAQMQRRYGLFFPDLFRTTAVFCFINISWLVFRSASLQELYLFVHSLKNLTVPFGTVHPFTAVVLFAATLLQVPNEAVREMFFKRYTALPFAVKVGITIACFISLNIVSMSGIPPFIYFQF